MVSFYTNSAACIGEQESQGRKRLYLSTAPTQSSGHRLNKRMDLSIGTNGLAQVGLYLREEVVGYLTGVLIECLINNQELTIFSVEMSETVR
jgi:hypothetical protein